MEKERQIALFDMDGTLCDFETPMIRDMEKLRSPSEKTHSSKFLLDRKNAPKYIRERQDLIKSQEDWWANLPKLKLGWDVLKVAKKLGFRIMILTKTPSSQVSGLPGKSRWLRKYLPNVESTMTMDKGLVYGKVLVDDYPEYIKAWIKHRPRGLVIMPASKTNQGFRHPQVIRYNGKNLKEVTRALKIVRDRKSGSILY